MSGAEEENGTWKKYGGVGAGGRVSGAVSELNRPLINPQFPNFEFEYVKNNYCIQLAVILNTLMVVPLFNVHCSSL